VKCNGNNNQRFTLDNQNRLVITHSNKCVDVKSDGSGNLIQWDCHTGNNQKWEYNSTKQLKARNDSTRCLVVGQMVGGVNDPYSLYMTYCNDNEAKQKFEIVN
jgi:hypothetical protein